MKNVITKEQVLANMQDVIVKTVVEFGHPTTYVTVKMKNGFTLRESTTCVDAQNYDEEIGKQICLQKIEDKIWFLLGFLLKENLSNSDSLDLKKSETFLDRLLVEKNELNEKYKKLVAFTESANFCNVIKDEYQRDLLIRQKEIMAEYLNILIERLCCASKC